MKITFIIVNTFGTYIAKKHLQECEPYKRRSVSIELTPEQLQKLQLKEVGEENGKKFNEEILDCFIET